MKELTIVLNDYELITKRGEVIKEFPNDSGFMHFKIDHSDFKIAKEAVLSTEVMETIVENFE